MRRTRPMHLTPPTLRMHQAVTDRRAPKIAIDVDFDSSVQALGALEAAAYRLIGTATCQLERVGDRFVCHLVFQDGRATGGSSTIDADGLRVRFLDLVTDENLRARVSAKTDGVRNVILALAFGSLAASKNEN